MAFEPFCHDAEGWKTVSLLRSFDLTPCFEEGILLSALYAVVTVTAISRSIFAGRQDALERTNKSRWILRGKLTLLVLAFGISIANFSSVLYLSLRVPVLQSYILEAVSLLAILCLTYVNHIHTRRSSSIILIYWPLHTIFLSIWTRTALSTHPSHLFLTLPLKWTIGGLGLMSFVLESIGSELDIRPKDGVYQEHPTLTANIYSIWSFGWMTPLMKRGATQYIVEEDLPNISPKDECVKLEKRLRQALKKHPLWRALFVAYGKTYGSAALLKFSQDALAFAQPQLLRMLLVYISRYQSVRLLGAAEKPSPLEGFSIAFLMFLASTAQTVLLNQYFQRAFVTGMRIRAGLVSVIYDKALKLSNDEMGRATGDIVNLMSVDATRLQDFCQFGLIGISGPFQITLAFISLYNLLGWPAFIGVAIMILSVPLNTTMARILKKMQKKQMGNRDKRTRLMSELLANIKSIKLYAWEFTFMRKIIEVRNNQELVMLKKIGLLTSANSMLWNGVPLLVAFSSFAVAAATSDKPLTSDVIFPAITLFLLLSFPLAMFAQVTSNIIEAVVSLQRISQFLKADELQDDARKVEEKSQLKKGDEVVSIKAGEFSWSKTVANPTLEDINMTVRKGELVGVLGRVGSGKSSLLSAILGDMTRTEGEVKVYGNISYASQNQWILSATVRQNILFFHEYDETFYNLVIEACALGPDLVLLPNGDATEVGEKGITLSGGQRARIALARAVYARADLVLLDDCLAAVDSHVARHIFDRVIGPNGILATKARILVTNSVSFLSQFDQLLFVRRGIILERGNYTSLMEDSEGEFAKLVRGSGNTSSGSSTPYPKRSSGSATPVEAELLQDKSLESSLLSEKLRRKGSFGKATAAAPEPLRQQTSVGLSQEHREQGTVKSNVYGEYIKAASKTASFAFVMLSIASQTINVLANLVLRSWGEHNREEGSNEGMFRYLLLYGVCSLSSVLCSGGSAILVWVYCSIRSAQRLHDTMLDALIRAPLGYFEITPTGRLLNLFTRDIYVVDQVLARMFGNLVRTMASTLLIIVVIGANFPAFLLSIIPLSWFYLRVMRYYLATSRELKRLDSVSRSPIFAWFGESLAGLGTVRAFGMQTLFQTVNHRRVDRNQICYLSSISVNRWLSLRLEFVGGLIIFTVVCLAVVQLITTGVDAGLVGLVLSYALNATSSLNWVVRSASEVEQNMVAVERILHQIELPSEAPLELPERPTEPWPTKGEIVFNNYSTKYRQELDLVLRNLSFTIKGGERLGICGRTGAGKSSIVQSIFRIIEPVEGTILIDGVDITKLGLHELRSGCSTVPQHPELYEGTIRENVDPVGQYSDAEIWAALEQAHLREFISSVGGLDTAVREGGSSLSAGQRQLICFARAIIKKAKILILDEATSAVDLETDHAIQSIIRSLTDVTVITIAHRLNTVMDYDRILVMDSGTVAELDTPQALLANKDSVFYSLASETGLTT